MTSGCGDSEWLASVSLDPMGPGDVDRVREIDLVSFPSAWSAESYLRELRNRNCHYVVARSAGEIVGYAGMWIIGTEAHISTLAVHPTCRRRGLGRRLLSHLLDFAETGGATEVTLEVREPNRIARRLYEAFGFRSQGLIPHYYGDTGEDAIIMRKAFDPEAERRRMG